MSLLHWPGRLLWHIPGRFKFASLLGRHYSLRCILFHHIAEQGSPFTDGLGIAITPREFEARMQFIVRHYTPVSLDSVLRAARGEELLPHRPVLVTFDDAYASVAEHAAKVCAKYGVPAVFFVNAAFVDNAQLSLDNLICYVANRFGFSCLQASLVAAVGGRTGVPQSLAAVFGAFLPTLSLGERWELGEQLSTELRRRHGGSPGSVALYVTSHQLRTLSLAGFEIANHTYSHVHCRTLSGTDFDSEILRNKATLEAITGQPVRAFSVPYGSSADVTAELAVVLRRTGHEALFVVESAANAAGVDLFLSGRVTVHSRTDADSFGDLEVLPRLRSIRNRIVPRRRDEMRRVAAAVAGATSKYR